ncbi:UDP-glucose 4-epimerase family protein [Trinickia acidisoli]|uniref:UDP-glucose 4-epimerase family protein n=1 Tax=Trinickia acidisoli TaxID=2767482 RepID=UPI0035ABBAFE
MKTLVVTGANGFVGRALCATLVARGHAVTGLVRRSGGCVEGVSEWVHSASDFEGLESAWLGTARADCVIHLAARVHVMRDTAIDPLASYRAANVDGMLRVARAAHANGARRLLLLSSIKALGDADRGHPLGEGEPPMPDDPYGQSKLEAERALREFARESGLECVIVRPPLVYGPGVRANFLQLMSAIARGIPLPLGAVGARRSFVFVGNLVDALLHCAIDERAAGETFHVTDGYDPTVTELARMLAVQLRAPARLIPVRSSWLRLAGRILGRSAQVERLVGELQLDGSHIRRVLGWQPPYTVEDGLRETTAWYRSTH